MMQIALLFKLAKSSCYHTAAISKQSTKYTKFIQNKYIQQRLLFLLPWQRVILLCVTFLRFLSFFILWT